MDKTPQETGLRAPAAETACLAWDENRYEAVMILDENLRCVDCNNTACGLLGYSKQEIKGLRFNGDIVPRPEPLHAADIITRISDSFARFRKKNGSILPVKYCLMPVKQNGACRSFRVSFLSAAQECGLKDRLEEAEQVSNSILSELPAMVLRCRNDQRLTVEQVSDSCLTLTGYSREDFLSRKVTLTDLVHPDYLTALKSTILNAAQSGHACNCEYIIITASGAEKWVNTKGIVCEGGKGKTATLRGIMIDLSERKAKEEEILYLILHDTMTGLFNRLYLDSAFIEIDVEENLPVSVIFADIDGLKFINDVFGHFAGDRLIIAAAGILHECCDKKDILARIGGDEFCIIMPRTDYETAVRRMGLIKQKCETYNDSLKDSSFSLNISLGCSTKTSKEQDILMVRKEAEDYMYRRKLFERRSSKSDVVSSMLAALQENSNETREHVKRMEALARRLAERLGLSPEQTDDLALLATLHDIGKVGIDRSLLLNHRKLTADEMKEMKKHPEIGYRIALSTPELINISESILCHHERWDGKGYPQGLSGTDIPLLSRIISIIDAFDAMTNDRSYSSSFSKDEALEEIHDNAGSQFDPDIADEFLAMMST